MGFGSYDSKVSKPSSLSRQPWIFLGFDLEAPSKAIRYYSQTIKRMNEASEAGAEEDNSSSSFTKKDKRVAAQDYNSRRAAYRRQVSLLRKQYAEQVAKQRAADEAQRAAEQRELTRRRLERQRLKNVRSAQNAVKEEEKRKQREKEFEAYLEVKQEERDERNRRFRKARQLLIDELEAEADLWLTTPEEVEAAFTHEAEQLLWARPNGVLGAPSPSLDSHFWQYESHTVHLDKTYKTPRELLLEQLMEQNYEQATVDQDFWTPERVADREELEVKAKLRAMVRAEGRRALLSKQKEMLESYYSTKDDEIPKKMPAPNVKILANIKAQEREGTEILLNDPTKFFRFENENMHGANNDVTDGSGYSGPTLGAPVGLKDPLRDGTPGAGVFPIGIGKMPKADTRTQREKKRQEREQKMWEAAQAESVDEDSQIEMAAADQIYASDEPIDYDNNEWDSDDEEWHQGLDPVEDADIINTPPEHRYSEDDIRWVIGQLEQRMQYLESQMTRDIDSDRQRLRTQIDLEGGKTDDKDIQELLLSLTDEQMMALVDVDSQNLEAMPPNEVSEALGKVPGLSEDQVKRILELDSSLAGDAIGQKPPGNSDS